MSNALTLSQVTAHIAEHATESDLTRVVAVVKERRKALARQAAAAVTAGAAVEVVNIRPAALKGTRGTVESIDGASATVRFDESSTEMLRLARSRKICVPAEVREWSMPGIPLVCLRLI